MKGKFTSFLLSLLTLLFAGTVSAQTTTVISGGETRQYTARKAMTQKRTAAMQPLAADDASTLYGCAVEVPYGWCDYGINTVPQSNGGSFNLVKSGIVTNGGGVYADGMYYAISFNDGMTASNMKLNSYDVDNDWAQVSYDIELTHMAADLTFDPTTSQVYGAFSSDFGAYYLGTMSRRTGEITTVAKLPFRIATLSCDKEGELYGIGYADKKLYHINKASAECTEIGSVSATFDGWQSATFNWETGKLYAFLGDGWDFGGLYEITISGSGASAKMESCTKILDTDYGNANDYGQERILGLFFKQDITVENAVAPAAVSNLAAWFDGASLKGKVQFTLPYLDTNGKDLPAEVDFSITVDDAAPITGKGTIGTNVTADIEVATAGEHTITVVASLNGTKGIPTAVTAWAGYDTPSAPTGITLTAEGMTTRLAWTAPTGGIHGGTIGSLTYDVVRQPDGVKVASGISETTFSETISSPIITEYWYDVTAISGTLTGEAASSNHLRIGTAVTAPYSENFQTEDGFKPYTVIDSNRDGKLWAYTSELGGQATFTGSDYNASDDWLITPAVVMKAGELYKFGFTIKTYRPETFRVAFGAAATAEGLTTELLPATTVNGNYMSEYFYYTLTTSVKEDGLYYFGIQVLTDANGTTLYADDITIDVIPSTAPAQPENFTVTPGAQGALSATLNFNAPTKCINGNTLSGIKELNIYRNKNLIHTYTEVTPGQAFTYEDSGMQNDKYEYTVAATNDVAQGAEASITKFIGMDKPGSIRNLKVVEDLDKPGYINISWDAPSEVGQNGGYVDVNRLEYYLLEPINGDLSLGRETSCTDWQDVSDGQIAAGYTIYAVGAGGSGKDARVTASQTIGPALDLPMIESFAGVTLKSGPWLPETISGNLNDAMWEVSDAGHWTAGTQDNDGGAMLFSGKIGCAKNIRTPKVDISKAANPSLTFHLYSTGKADKVVVGVSKEYGEFRSVLTITLNEAETGWHRYEVPLKEFADSRFIQIGFAGHILASATETIALDNVMIRDIVAKDIEAGTLSGPREVAAGSEAAFTLDLRNIGVEKIAGSEYKVELYRNGKLAATFDGVDIAADLGRATIDMTDTPTVADAENTVYHAVVNFAADADTKNNTSTRCPIYIKMPLYPAIADLEGRVNAAESKVSLTWSEPDVASMPATPTTDNVESYKDFAIDNIGNWRTIDADGEKTVRISIDGLLMYEYEHAGEAIAFQVMNPEEAGIYLNAFTPRSGKKVFFALACAAPDAQTPAKQNDDWLISPELNGAAQTVSFYAKGAQGISETFEVRYSTTTPDTDAFMQHDAATFNTPQGNTQWLAYNVELPEGAKYFAIRYISNAKVALLVDDITYTPMGAPVEDIVLMGYNIYRDGTKLNAEPLGDSAYDDPFKSNDGKPTYNVTAVYDKGESVFSNDCTIDIASGIDGVESTTVRIIGANGSIRIAGAEGMNVKIYTADGKLLHHDAAAAATAEYPAAAGVYAVTVNGHSAKVLVK